MYASTYFTFPITQTLMARGMFQHRGFPGELFTYKFFINFKHLWFGTSKLFLLTKWILEYIVIIFFLKNYRKYHIWNFLVLFDEFCLKLSSGWKQLWLHSLQAYFLVNRVWRLNELNIQTNYWRLKNTIRSKTNKFVPEDNCMCSSGTSDHWIYQMLQKKGKYNLYIPIYILEDV